MSNSLIVTSSNEGGTWRTTGVYTNEASVALNYPLDGRYRVEVYAQDIAGNSWSGAPIFTVDKILPQIVLTGISNKYTNRTVTVTADLLDKNIDPAASAVTVNGVPATLTATPTNVTASVTLSAEDRYRISVSAVDLAGNADSYNTEVNIDRTEPGGGINSPSNHLNYFQEVHFAAQAGDMPKSAGDSGVRTVDWDVIDDGSGVTTTFSSSNCDERTRSVKPDPGFSIKRDQFYEGAFTLRLRLTDWAGNAFTNSRKFVIDRTPPVVDFFADDGVSGIVSAGTNFSQDISSNKSFDVIVQAWDINNIRKIIILEGPNSGGPMTELARWETNDDGVTNAGYTNAAPGYQTVKAERRKMDIIVEDFAGNAQPYSLTFGYTNSTPPWFTFRGETPGGAAQTVIMHDSHLVSGSDHNIFFDAYGLADLKKVTVSYFGRDIQYYRVGRRVNTSYGFYYRYTDYNVTNETVTNYDINIGPDITNHNNIGPFYVEKDVISNMFVTVITNVLISNVVTTNRGDRGDVIRTNVYTNDVWYDYNTNFVFYGYKDGMSRVQIQVEDIFGTQWDFNRDCYVDVTPPHISIDCLENTGSTRTYRFSLSDSLSPITEKTIQWDSWTGFLHLYYQGPLWANFDWVNTFIGGHYYFWFRTSDFWNNRNDSATSNPYHFNFW